MATAAAASLLELKGYGAVKGRCACLVKCVCGETAPSADGEQLLLFFTGTMILAQ